MKNLIIWQREVKMKDITASKFQFTNPIVNELILKRNKKRLTSLKQEGTLPAGDSDFSCNTWAS